MLFIYYLNYWVFVPPYIGILWQVPHLPLLRPGLKPRNNRRGYLDTAWPALDREKRESQTLGLVSLILGVLKFPNHWDENNPILVRDGRQPRSSVDHCYHIIQIRNRGSVHVTDMPKKRDPEGGEWGLDSIPGRLRESVLWETAHSLCPHKND